MKKTLVVLIVALVLAIAYLSGLVITLKMERDSLAESVSNLQNMVVRGVSLAELNHQKNPANPAPSSIKH